MLNRSAVLIGHEPAFYGWLKTTGVTDDEIAERREIAERVVYLVAACHFPEETEEVIEDVFGAIFELELRRWQPNEKHWPEPGDFDLFTRWFTVEACSVVEDVGRGPLDTESLSSPVA